MKVTDITESKDYIWTVWDKPTKASNQVGVVVAPTKSKALWLARRQFGKSVIKVVKTKSVY